MSALQIYVWEVQHSTGAARNYAYHHLDLYLMVMSHLGKTYWTADLQHNLFVEALRVIRGASSTLGTELNGSVNEAKINGMDLPSSGLDSGPADSSLMHGTLEDFLLSFNPFVSSIISTTGLRTAPKQIIRVLTLLCRWVCQCSRMTWGEPVL